MSDSGDPEQDMVRERVLRDEYYGPVCIDCGHPMPTRYDHHKTCDCTTCDMPG